MNLTNTLNWQGRGGGSSDSREKPCCKPTAACRAMICSMAESSAATSSAGYLAGGMARAGLFQRCRTQEAADMVGATAV